MILRRAAHEAIKAWATPTGAVPPSERMKPSPHRVLLLRRPFTVMTALGTAAHHTFEVRAGVGLVFEPFIGRRGAIALWAIGLPAWAIAAWLGEGKAVERWLALNNGAGLGGGIVHYVVWPWELRGGIPQLVEAEGEAQAAARLQPGSAAVGTCRCAGARAGDPAPRAALGVSGLLLGEPLRRSAIHHFRWAHQQAERDPERWSPMLREQSSGHGERAA